MAARSWSGPWQQVPAGKPALARDWAQAVVSVGTPRAEVELHLRRHLESLHDALLAVPVDAAAAERVGASLAAQCDADPQALATTIALLGDRLLAEIGLDEVTFLSPLHLLLGSLAAGFARSVGAR